MGIALIAGKLLLSLSTVKTHCEHIYKKFGVTSREELLDYLEERHSLQRLLSIPFFAKTGLASLEGARLSSRWNAKSEER